MNIDGHSFQFAHDAVLRGQALEFDVDVDDREDDVLIDSWFQQTEPVLLADPVVLATLDFEYPILRPRIGFKMLVLMVVVLAPLIYAGIAMT